MLGRRATNTVVIQLLMRIAAGAICMLLLGMPAVWAIGDKPLLHFRRAEDANSNQQPHETIHLEQALLPAVHIEDRHQHGIAKSPTERRLLVPSESKSTMPISPTARDDASRKRSRRIPRITFPKMDAWQTAGTGLGIVLGLFLISAWLLKRGGPRPTAPLPKEVVSMLGRAQLASRQFVQLMRVGNKLVLVALTPDGATPITEVTDPMEVDRLLGLCMRNHTQSTSAEFQQVLNQLSRESTKGFLG